MKDLSLHILDIMQNSIAAKADIVRVIIEADVSCDLLTLSIEDNGVGMDDEFVKKVTDPFVTSRITRKVGLGISLLQASAQRASGNLEISSVIGKGTTLKAYFQITNIDRLPLGNIADTIMSMVMSNSEIEFELSLDNKDLQFEFDTREIKNEIGNVPITQFEVLTWIREYIDEGIKLIFGGVLNEVDC